MKNKAVSGAYIGSFQREKVKRSAKIYGRVFAARRVQADFSAVTQTSPAQCALNEQDVVLALSEIDNPQPEFGTVRGARSLPYEGMQENVMGTGRRNVLEIGTVTDLEMPRHVGHQIRCGSVLSRDTCTYAVFQRKKQTKNKDEKKRSAVKQTCAFI